MALRTFVLFALIGHYMERLGVLRCGCSSQCWCHTPGPSLFRWVVPYGHTGCEGAAEGTAVEPVVESRS